MGGVELVVVGPTGPAHVASQLARAAARLGIACDVIDTSDAYDGPRAARAIAWRVFDRRPLRRQAFARRLTEQLADVRPRTIVAIGQAPLTEVAIETLRASGARVQNYSTDDPFNPAHRARWHLRNLPAYTTVFTTRRSNMGDLQGLGCKNVQYLPFAYDDTNPALAQLPAGDKTDTGVLFVGGADADRVRFFEAFAQHGLPTSVAGGYWDRWTPHGMTALGVLSIEQIDRLTQQAAVNICLVRRANRDGHVMRSFEIPAAGGFMVAEDTQEHRALFGAEGVAVLYFSTPREAAEKCHWALERPGERRRMAEAAHRLIIGGGHAYRDRLRTMLDTACP